MRKLSEFFQKHLHKMVYKCPYIVKGIRKNSCKIPRQTVGNFPIIVERSFSAVSHKEIAEKTNEIRSENDETKHKLKHRGNNQTASS